MVMAWGHGEKDLCDRACFLSAPLAMSICGVSSSGGSEDSLPSFLCIWLWLSTSLCICVLVSVSLCTPPLTGLKDRTITDLVVQHQITSNPPFPPNTHHWKTNDLWDKMGDISHSDKQYCQICLD